MKDTISYLQFGEGNDVTILRSMPHCFLAGGVVVVKPRGVLVKQLPPLVVIGLFSGIKKEIC